MKKIVDVLRANAGKRIRVTFHHGTVESLLIGSVDGEALCVAGQGGNPRTVFWARLEDVKLLETVDPD